MILAGNSSLFFFFFFFFFVLSVFSYALAAVFAVSALISWLGDYYFFLLFFSFFLSCYFL